jgi:hypothetical protein
MQLRGEVEEEQEVLRAQAGNAGCTFAAWDAHASAWNSVFVAKPSMMPRAPP